MALGWAVLLAVWAGASYLLGVKQYFLASPGRVFSYAVENWTEVIASVGYTASEAVAGWILAAALGVAIGAGIYYLPWGRRLILPPLVALQTTPIIALAPLVTFWFGYGWLAKAVVAGVVAVFPVVLATYSGLGDARPAHVQMYQLCGVGEFRVFREVRLRSAWGAVLASLKVAAVFAVIGSIVADFMGGGTGLGFMIMRGTQNTKGDVLVTGVILSAVLGQALLIAVEKGVGAWGSRSSG